MRQVGRTCEDAPLSSRFIDYFVYDRDAPITCPCGWHGIARGHEEHYSELFDVACPECETTLLVISYPTADETRAAAAAGNEDAQRALGGVEYQEARYARALASQLSDTSALPRLVGKEIRLEWDFAEIDGDDWTIIRHEGVEIWRELAFYEGFERFRDVVGLLRVRYGSRLRELRPTEASELYLYGDDLSASNVVAGLNARLAASS